MTNWEIGIDIYTLIFIKWVTFKNLLYKRINKIKFKNKKERCSREGSKPQSNRSHKEA